MGGGSNPRNSLRYATELYVRILGPDFLFSVGYIFGSFNFMFLVVCSLQSNILGSVARIVFHITHRTVLYLVLLLGQRYCNIDCKTESVCRVLRMDADRLSTHALQWKLVCM